MKYVRSYLQYRWRQFLLFGVFFLMQGVMAFLLSIPVRDMGYFLLLEIVIVVLFSATEMYHYINKIKRLEQMNQVEQMDLSLLPKSSDDLERGYESLLYKINDSRQRLLVEEEKNKRDMQDYYAMWVHQIKTPIAAMQLLLQTCCQEEEHFSAEITRDLEQELFSINNYVEMALQYQRLNAKDNDFVFRKRNLDKIVRDAIHKYAKIMIQKKITLHYEKIDFAVVTDEKWLQFVIEQLLSNAIKYTRKGSITISFREAGEQDGGVSYLIIKDTGIGIHAEDLPRICENGYTGYNGHADKKSTGIGLYLCKQILTRMSHTIHFESEVGTGTAVYIGFVNGGEEE